MANRTLTELIELLTEKCMYIYKELYNSNQQYKENCRSIENKCRQEGKKLKCINQKFKDKEGHLYPNVRRFRRGGTPSGTQTNQQESERKRRGEKILKYFPRSTSQQILTNYGLQWQYLHIPRPLTLLHRVMKMPAKLLN